VLLQLLGTDIENSLYKYRVSYRHLTWLKHFNCWWKAVKHLICYSCIFNVQLHVHLKKWTLKFKLLYLKNYISYSNKMCSICCVNTHIQSLKVGLKSILSWLKYSIFSRGLFFIGAPCILFYVVYVLCICFVYCIITFWFNTSVLCHLWLKNYLLTYLSKPDKSICSLGLFTKFVKLTLSLSK